MAFSANKLRAVRTSRGMSQRAVARQMGVPPHYVCTWESGKNGPGGQNMVKLLQALGCDLEDVTTEDSK